MQDLCVLLGDGQYSTRSHFGCCRGLIWTVGPVAGAFTASVDRVQCGSKGIYADQTRPSPPDWLRSWLTWQRLVASGCPHFGSKKSDRLYGTEPKRFQT